MAGNTGRHDADENATDRTRIDFLAGDGDVELDPADRAELEELRALLADPTLWSEPPAELEDSVVALIAAEVRATTDLPATPETGDGQPDRPSVSPDTATHRLAGAPAEPTVPTVPTAASEPAPVSEPAAPIDLAAARDRKQARSRFTRPAFLVAAAAAVVAVALSAVLILRDSPAQRRFDVALSATELAPGAAGTAVMLKTDSGWEIELNATGLPRRENGEFYQAWLRNADGVLVPIGTFNEGTEVVLWGGVSPEVFNTMTITLETADGNQDSSGERVLVGTAVER